MILQYVQVQAPTDGEALEGFNGEATFRWQRWVKRKILTPKPSVHIKASA